jgi:hypothetical protein
MPTFNFSDDYSPLEKRVFMRAARVACRELKADQYDASIGFVRGPLPRSSKAAIACVGPKEYLLITNSDMTPLDIVHAIGHELIHFHQFARGDMREQPGRIIWKGKSFPVVHFERDGAKAYLNQPWEKEAFAKHDELFKAVVAKIPKADREALDEEFLNRGGECDDPIVKFVRELTGYLGECGFDVKIDNVRRKA